MDKNIFISNKKTYLLGFLGTLIYLWYLSPLFSFNLRGIGLLIITLLFLFILIINYPNLIKKLYKDAKYFIFLIIFLVIMFLLSNDLFLINRSLLFVNFFILFFPFYYLKNINKKYIKFATIIFFISVLLTSITTISYLLVDPQASRNLATNNPNPSYLNAGVGGFQFIYSLVYITPFLFLNKNGFFKNKNSNLIINTFLFLLFSITIYLSNYVIAFLSFILIFILKKLNFFQFLAIVLCVIFLYLVLFIFKENLFQFIQTIDNLIYKQRLTDIWQLVFNLNIQTNSSLFERLEVYLVSFEEFKRYVLFGNLFSVDKNFGNHSEIIDSLAKFGILFSPFYFYLVLRIHTFFSSNKRNNSNSIMILYFIIIGLLNPLFSAQLVAMISLYTLYDKES